MPSLPKARSTTEIDFASTLLPCEACGKRNVPTLYFYRDSAGYLMSGLCPDCRKPRAFSFLCDGDPVHAKHDRLELGGHAPSEIIPQRAFEEELERLAPMLRSEPRSLAPGDWAKANDANERAVICARELCKFPNVDARFFVERDRLNARADRFRADIPRFWLERDGKLALGSEILGLLHQIARDQRPRAADLQRYISSRAIKQAAVSSIRAHDEGDRTKIVLTVTIGTIDDVKHAVFGKKWEGFDVEGHLVSIATDVENGVLRRVTLTW